MIKNYKKNRLKRRIRKLRLIIFMSLKNTAVLACIAGFIAVSVPMFSAYEAHVINVTARIENDAPFIDPPVGEFCNDGSLTVKLYASLSGAYIINTINGSDPDCFTPNGAIYSGPFPLTNSATVKARTCHNDKQSIIIDKYFNVSSEYCEKKEYCNALSAGYWKNHEGCPANSNWTSQINALSSGELSGAFGSILGKDICFYLAPSNCGPGGTVAGQLCRAKGKALADLSNIVSNHLDLDALIAGADDGDEAFDNLGLNSNSTVREALIAIENIIANQNSSRDKLRDAAHISERIYSFYEEDNPNKPWCIYSDANSFMAPDSFLSPPVFNAEIVELPAPVCGNGHIDVDINETCDDGNLISKDGCSDACQTELFAKEELAPELLTEEPIAE